MRAEEASVDQELNESELVLFPDTVIDPEHKQRTHNYKEQCLAKPLIFPLVSPRLTILLHFTSYTI